MNQNLSIGIIGMGSMGSFVARAILSGKVPGVKLLAVAEVRPLPDDLARELEAHSVSVVDSFEALLKFPIRLAVECANQKVVRECAPLFIARGIDLLIMSVGALVQGDFFRDLARDAEEKGVRIYLPSGAVGAIDALQAAKLQGLEKVTLTTRKPPRSLGKIEGVDLEGLKEPRVIFEGPARKPWSNFPRMSMSPPRSAWQGSGRIGPGSGSWPTRRSAKTSTRSMPGEPSAPSRSASRIFPIRTTPKRASWLASASSPS